MEQPLHKPSKLYTGMLYQSVENLDSSFNYAFGVSLPPDRYQN